MSGPGHEFEVLISGYLDGELDAGEQRRLEDLVEQDPALRREYHAMRTLVRGTAAVMQDDAPGDDTWDGFLDGVYNRAERTAGWVLAATGGAALAVYGIAMFLLQLEVPLTLKILLGVPVAGVAVLFASVLRQRLHSIKTDRYSSEVHR